MRVISQDANPGPQIWSSSQKQVSGLLGALQLKNGGQAQGQDSNPGEGGLVDAGGTLQLLAGALVTFPSLFPLGISGNLQAAEGWVRFQISLNELLG